MFIQKLDSAVFLLLLCLCLSVCLHAQPANDSAAGTSGISPSDFNSFTNQNSSRSGADAGLDSLKKISSHVTPDSLSNAYRMAILRYDMDSLDHRHRVFEWQLSSSKYIFIVVNIIVLVGLMLSVWQFYLPIYRMNKMAKQNAVTKEVSHTVIEENEKKETSVSTIKLGKDGVEITSPVIGLLILVISVAFFFMYIHYVYPVSEVAASQQTETKSSK